MWQLKSLLNWCLMGASKNGVFISIAMFDSQKITTWSCWGFKYGGFWECGHHENHGFEHWTGPIFNLGYPHFWKAPNMYFCQGCDFEPYQDIPRWCCEEILAPHPWSPKPVTVTMDHRCLPPGCDWDGHDIIPFWLHSHAPVLREQAPQCFVCFHRSYGREHLYKWTYYPYN